jgi:hypothetical protein
MFAVALMLTFVLAPAVERHRDAWHGPRPVPLVDAFVSQPAPQSQCVVIVVQAPAP